MNKEQKQEVIETLKNKFSQYSNFYITDTQNLSVAQITNLRRHCFDKQVEMKVAKNTLIKKALESLDNDKYSGVYDSLHQVTALMFSDSPKEPALIISSFRKSLNGEKPLLKAAFLNGDIFVGDNQLITLTKIKTKNELIGEVIGLLMSPIQRVIGALQNRFDTAEVTEHSTKGAEAKVEASEPKAVAAEAKADTQSTAETKTEVTTGPASAKVDIAESKTVATETKADTQSTAETKAEVTEPASAKVEVAEPKAIATEAKPETQVVAETKAEVIEPASAKVEVAEPEAVAIEVKSAAPIVAETKAEIIEPASEVTPPPEAKVEITEPVVKEAKPETKGTETQPES